MEQNEVNAQNVQGTEVEQVVENKMEEKKSVLAKAWSGVKTIAKYTALVGIPAAAGFVGGFLYHKSKVKEDLELAAQQREYLERRAARDNKE